MRSVLPWLLAAAVLFVAGCGGSKPTAATSTQAASPFNGSEIVGSPVAPGFALHDQAGRLVKLSSQQGRIALVTFLYTHCADVCPAIAGQLNTAMRQLGPSGRDVRVFAISVDPKGDTAAAVRHFVAAHRLLPQFRYLTGTAAQLEPVWASYHVASNPQKKSSAVDHSAYVILVDQKGVERTIYDARVKAADVVHDVNVLRKK